MVTLTVTDGTLNDDGRGNFEIEDLPLLLSEKELIDYENERSALMAKGNDGNFSKLYDITIIDKDGFELTVKFYMQRASSPLVRVRFKSKIGDVVKYNYQPYLNKNYNVDDVIQLDKVKAKHFKIV